ncbi:MAG: GNAT family protein [Bacteroidota bacterium]
MLRILNHKDLDQFLQIRQDSLRFNPEAFGASATEKIDREQTRQNLKNNSEENFIFGYFEEQQLLGIAGFIRHQRAKARHKGFIWGVFVYPEQRGKGIGRALMLACLEKAQQIVGLEKINLSVMAVQRRALRLYQQLGFEIYGVEKGSRKVIGRYYDEVLMAKQLEAKGNREK